MITAAQIRGARAMIGMSIEALAAASRLPASTIEALEKGDWAGEPHAVLDVRNALEAHGVIFIASGNQDEGGPGVRLRARVSSDDGIRPENLNAANDD
ncbi:helix-turn-helix domain-containing protein [Rhizobium binxianense]